MTKDVGARFVFTGTVMYLIVCIQGPMHSLRTVNAIVLTQRLELAAAPGNFLLTRAQSGLEKDSVVNVSQLVTLDRTYLRERAGGIPDDMLEQLDRGLRLVLDK